MDWVISLGAFWALAACYFLLVRSVSKNEPFARTASGFIPAALIFQLMLYLIQFRAAMAADSPFQFGKRDIYAVYSELYFIAAAVCFTVYAAWDLRRKDLLRLPALGLFGYLLWTLSAIKLYPLAAMLAVVFMLTVFIRRDQTASARIGSILEKALAFVSRKEVIFVTGLFIAAFTARYFFGSRLLALTGDQYLRASDDGLTYAPYAVQWAHGLVPGKYEQPDGTYWGGFGYWVFLGVIYKIFGDYNHPAAIFFQAALSATAPVSIYFITKTIFKKPAAVIAGVLTALDMNLIFLSGVNGMESLYIPAFYAGLVLLINGIRHIEGLKLLYAAFIGVILGFVNTIRSEVFLFPFAAGALVILFARKRAGAFRTILISAALIAGFILPLALHATRNYVNYNKFTFMSSQASACFSKDVNGSPENAELAKMGFNPFADPGLSIKVFKEHPKTVARLLSVGFIKRAALLFFIPNFGTFDPVMLVNPGSGFVYNYALALKTYGCLLIAAGLILAFKCRENILEKWIIVSFIFSIVCTYGLVMVTNSRHRGVITPLLFAFLGFALHKLWEATALRRAEIK